MSTAGTDNRAVDATKGVSPESDSSDDRQALRSPQKRYKAADVAKFGKEDIAKVLQGQYLPPKETISDETPAEAEEMSTIKQILAAAKQHGLKLTRSEMEGLLEGDDEQTEFVLKKIELRKDSQAANA